MRLSHLAYQGNHIWHTRAGMPDLRDGLRLGGRADLWNEPDPSDPLLACGHAKSLIIQAECML